MEIRIGVVGRIVRGDHAGCFVKVVDDAANTGGFLILVSPDPAFRSAEGSDGWVARPHLEQYFNESHWEIQWISETP